MTSVAVFANHLPGLEVCKYLHSAGVDIEALYLDGLQSDLARRTIDAAGVAEDRVFAAEAIASPEHLEWLRGRGIEFFITVYWPYLLKPEAFGIPARGCVNFHPALLPINRGWFPHVHSILDGSPAGVTLHAIDVGADTGPIWAQERVPLLPTDTAKDIYDRLQTAIVDLFARTWPDIAAGRIEPVPQDNSKAVYHKKSEIAGLDLIDPNKTYTGADLINLLRARSFGSRGFAYFLDESGEKVYLNLRLSRQPVFE